MQKAQKIKRLIQLIESKTNRKLVFTEDIKRTKAVEMTPKQFFNDQSTVDKVYKKGYDVKLTNLKEETDPEELFYDEGYNKEYVDDEVDEYEDTANYDFTDDYSDDDFYEDDFLIESEEKSKTIDFSGELCKLIKKLGKANGGDWKSVKSTIEGAWTKVTNDGKKINNNNPQKLK